MQKKIFCILLILIVAFNCITAFAIDSKMIFTDVKYYTAKIYVCDTQNSKAILLNVVPTNGSYNFNLTREIEYKALPLSTGAVYGSKGQKLTMDVINGYLLDSPVKVMIGKNGYGYKILQMEFLR